MSEFEILVANNEVVDVRNGKLILDVIEHDYYRGTTRAFRMTLSMSKTERKITRKYFRC